MSSLTVFFSDRIQLVGVLVVFCFISLLSMESTSGASYSTYFVALLMLITFRQWADVFSYPATWPIVAILIYLPLSSLWSEPYQNRAFVSQATRGMLIFFFVVAAAECQLRGQMQTWLARALAVVGSLSAIAAITMFYITNPEDGRLQGLGVLHAHVVAALVFGTSLIFVLSVVVCDKGVWRGLALGACLILAVAIFLSDSRNAWVSVLLGAGVYWLTNVIPQKSRFLKLSTVFGAGLAILLSLLVWIPETRVWFLPRGDSFRLEIWSHYLGSVLPDHLWLGLGVNTSTEVVAGGILFTYPHSLYVALIYQGGLIAFGLFTWLMVSTLKILWRNYHLQDAKIALGILTLALTAFLLDGNNLVDKINESWVLIWFPVAIALGIRWRPSL